MYRILRSDAARTLVLEKGTVLSRAEIICNFYYGAVRCDLKSYGVRCSSVKHG